MQTLFLITNLLHDNKLNFHLNKVVTADIQWDQNTVGKNIIIHLNPLT